MIHDNCKFIQFNIHLEITDDLQCGQNALSTFHGGSTVGIYTAEIPLSAYVPLEGCTAITRSLVRFRLGPARSSRFARDCKDLCDDIVHHDGFIAQWLERVTAVFSF